MVRVWPLSMCMSLTAEQGRVERERERERGKELAAGLERGLLQTDNLTGLLWPHLVDIA